MFTGDCIPLRFVCSAVHNFQNCSVCHSFILHAEVAIPDCHQLTAIIEIYYKNKQQCLLATVFNFVLDAPQIPVLHPVLCHGFILHVKFAILDHLWRHGPTLSRLYQKKVTCSLCACGRSDRETNNLTQIQTCCDAITG